MVLAHHSCVPRTDTKGVNGHPNIPGGNYIMESGYDPSNPPTAFSAKTKATMRNFIQSKGSCIAAVGNGVPGGCSSHGSGKTLTFNVNGCSWYRDVVKLTRIRMRYKCGGLFEWMDHNPQVLTASKRKVELTIPNNVDKVIVERQVVRLTWWPPRTETKSKPDDEFYFAQCAGSTTGKTCSRNYQCF